MSPELYVAKTVSRASCTKLALIEVIRQEEAEFHIEKWNELVFSDLVIAMLSLLALLEKSKTLSFEPTAPVNLTTATAVKPLVLMLN